MIEGMIQQEWGCDNLKKNILTKLTTKQEGDIEVLDVGVAEEGELLLPQVGDRLDMEEQYRQIMFFYEAGIQQVTAKLEILNKEFQYCNDRNPIENIKSRVKSPDSIIEKMKKKGLPLTFSCMMNNVFDIAGVRVVCPFITDVYHVSRMLMNQTDVEVLRIKDYIQYPKENGYRSLHVIVMVDVFFSDQMRKVPIELQFRTIAMNFWASTEHQLRYKKENEFTPDMHKQLKRCADLMARADRKMQRLAENLRVE